MNLKNVFYTWNNMTGTFQCYAEGKASLAMTSLSPSPDETSVSFKHISFNVKIQHPYGNPKFIGMIAGGELFTLQHYRNS